MKELKTIRTKVNLGINIGPNKENATKNDDYLRCIEKFYPLADYISY